VVPELGSIAGRARERLDPPSSERAAGAVMRVHLGRLVLVAFMGSVACVSPGSDRSGRASTGGAGGEATGGASGGATSTGGSVGTGGSIGTTGGSVGTGGSGEGTGGAPGGGADGGASTGDASSPPVPTTDGGAINVEGPIPPYVGPPVGPEVKMDCPDDPTQGFTEYKDTFVVERPYDLPVSARFSIDGGIYNFWVMHGDKKHSPTSTAANPRTEARYSQDFKTGIRLFSADVLWDKSVTAGTVVMQVHTTSTGIGPVYMVANGNGVSPLDSSKVMGGVIGRWVNLKVEINADTTASRYWINNCLVATQGKGTRGDGNDYFKMGVYHCDSGVCKDQYKNVHLYIKM
jgi:hypothetical protein